MQQSDKVGEKLNKKIKEQSKNIISISNLKNILKADILRSEQDYVSCLDYLLKLMENEYEMEVSKKDT